MFRVPAAKQNRQSEKSNTPEIYLPFFAKRIGERLKGFSSDARGNVAVIFATVMLPMLGLVGASIDYSRAITTRSQMAATIDAAALAAGSAIDLDNDARKELARKYIEANFSSPTEASFSTPVITLTDTTVHIKYEGTVPTTILGAVGINEVPISAETTVALKNTKLELALVLDATGSMGNGGKIVTLRSATWGLIDNLYDTDGASDKIKMAIVPFNWYTKIDTAFETATWIQNITPAVTTCTGRWWYRKCTTSVPPWDGCVRLRSGTADLTDAIPSASNPIPAENCTTHENMPVQELQTLTNSETTLKTKANSLQAFGGTDIPMGLAWGWKVLSSTMPYTEGASDSDDSWTKAIVLMSDGENCREPGCNGSASAQANTEMATICTNIKAKDITIYTVAFQISDSYTKSLMESCATDPAFYYDAGNNQSLKEAFSSITEQLSQLRLSK